MLAANFIAMFWSLLSQGHKDTAVLGSSLKVQNTFWERSQFKNRLPASDVLMKILWLVVLGFNATLTAKVISWCFLTFSHQY